jgi:glycosyltransferase involved in cell wall biosynthesis
MRLALFTDTYPEDVNGVARTLGMLVAHAAARGHRIALVTPRVSEEGAEHAVAHRQLFGVPIPIYPDLQLARGVDGPGKRMLEEFDPELVHVATESTVGLSGRNWAVRNGVPLVTSFHTYFPLYLHDYRMGFLEPAVWRYLRWFHDRSLLTFCPSHDTLEALRAQEFHPRLRIWGRGVDTELFGPHRRRAEVRQAIAPGADRILVYVGRLAAEKRVEVVLDAFPRIREATGPGTALVFVGDGPAGARLRARAGEGVYFTGFLHGESLAEAYAAGDLFVFASDTETFGNVVLEAVASGVPAVVADQGGVRESAIPGRTGVRARPNDPEAFADACIELLRDDAAREALARGAREYALSRSWEAILDGLLQEWAAARAVARGVADRRDLHEDAVAGESRLGRTQSPRAAQNAVNR